MKRRTCLAALGGGVAALAGVTVGDGSHEELGPDYRGSRPIVYDHDDLELHALRERVRLGETIAFEVTNVTDSRLLLGCHNPWAVQRYSEGEWQHVTWTGNHYYQQCATVLSPGGSLVERVELSESGLEAEADEVRTELRSGPYRFLLLGSSPFLATDFEVLDAL